MLDTDLASTSHIMERYKLMEQVMGKIVVTVELSDNTLDADMSMDVSLDGVTTPQTLMVAASFYASAVKRFTAEGLEKGMDSETCEKIARSILEIATANARTENEEVTP